MKLKNITRFFAAGTTAQCPHCEYLINRTKGGGYVCQGCGAAYDQEGREIQQGPGG